MSEPTLQRHRLQILQCGLLEGQRGHVHPVQRQRGHVREGVLWEEQCGEVGVCASEQQPTRTGDGQRLHLLEGRVVEGEGGQRRQVYASAPNSTPTRQRQRLLVLEALPVQLHRLQRRHYASLHPVSLTRLQRQRALLRGARAQTDLLQHGVVGEHELRLLEAVVVGGEGGQCGQVLQAEGGGLGEVIAVERDALQSGKV